MCGLHSDNTKLGKMENNEEIKKWVCAKPRINVCVSNILPLPKCKVAVNSVSPTLQLSNFFEQKKEELNNNNVLLVFVLFHGLSWPSKVPYLTFDSLNLASSAKLVLSVCIG